MARLRALRTTSGTYGLVGPGDLIDVSEEVAVQLESMGIVERVKEAPKHGPEPDEEEVHKRLEQSRKMLRESPENKDLRHGPENKGKGKPKK